MREDRHRLRMEAVEGANQLSSEYLEAVQSASFGTSKVEIEGAPVRVWIRSILPQNVELRLPAGSTVFPADWVGKRPVERIALGDAE